ncbi:hypothetical protein M9H77_30081 [Catharanthus roseus]|uniref:Uncharacterized protein n=1 Tax=Catharanthus roseus TaxID=4058 RepID=A0ACB9ZX27_CATRO|nr:hypothetical protein M9H77_30081 [Catharanthus roseus]
MKRDDQEAKELVQRPITGARVRKIKDYGDGLTKGMVALVEGAIRNGLKSMNEGIEDGGKPSKLFMINDISKEQQMERVGVEKVHGELKTGPTIDDRPYTAPTIHAILNSHNQDHNVRSAFRDKVLDMIVCPKPSKDCTGGSTCERGHSTWRVWPNRYYVRHRIMLRFVESQKGLETKRPELVSDDLVMRSGLFPWSPSVALHVLLNSGVEAALMCLDLLRLPSCVRTPHVGSSVSVVKATKEKCFLVTLMIRGASCSLVPRGKQIPYSAAINVVKGLGVSQIRLPQVD